MVIQMLPPAIVARSMWNYRAWMTAETFAVDELLCWTRVEVYGLTNATNVLKASPSFKPRLSRPFVTGSLPRINIARR